MHLSEELDDKRANGAPTSKRSSFNLSWCITRIWSITSRSLGWIYRNAVFDKEAVHEEPRTQKLKVAKLEEQNLEIPEISQELKDRMT